MRRLLLSAFLLFVFWNGFASEHPLLRGQEDRLRYEQPRLFIDRDAKHSIATINDVPFVDTFRDARDVLGDRVPGVDVWMRVDLKNWSADSLFNGFFQTNWYDDVMVWIIRKNGPDSIQTGYLSERPYADYFFYQYGFPFRLEPGEEVEVFIRFRHWSRYLRSHSMTLKIWSLAEFEQANERFFYDRRKTIYLDALFIGIFFFQFIYIFFQWFITRRIEYFYYTCYILTALVYFIARSSHILDIPRAHGMYGIFMVYLNNAMIVIPYFFFYRFGRFFLDMKSRLPAINRWVKRVEKLVLFMVALELIFSAGKGAAWTRIYSPFIDILILFVASVILLIWLARDRNMLTRFFVAGSVMVLLGSVLAIFWTFLAPQTGFFQGISAVTITKIGVMFETIIFNTGLLFKARQIENEKFAAEKKLIEEREEKMQIERERQEERDRLAADLHDDVGATLSGIGMTSDALRKSIREGKPEEAARMAEEISDNARDSISGMSDIVWAIKPQNDSFEKLLGRMRTIALNLLAVRGVKVNFEVQEPVPHDGADMMLRRNLFLIFKEAINNCAKYAEAKQVDIRFRFPDNGIEMEIMDDGKGFEEKALQRINGLKNMRNRALELEARIEIRSMPGNGTRILLKAGFKKQAG